MKHVKLLFAASLMACAALASAQPYTKVWANSGYAYSGGSLTQIRKGAVTSQGNIILSSSTSLDGGPTAAWSTIAINPSGTVLWQNIHNPGSGNCYPYGLATDYNGNVLECGITANNDALILKYDGSGNQILYTPYNGASNRYDFWNDIECDAEGNFFACGASQDADQGWSWIVAKYYPSGVRAWVRRWRIGTTNNGDEAGQSIAIGRTGNFYVVGTMRKSTNLAVPNLTVAKYDTNGNQLWYRQLDLGSNQSSAGSSVALDKYDQVYVAGSAVNSGNNSDGFIVKYGAAGAYQWSQIFGSSFGGTNPRSERVADLKVNPETGEAFIAIGAQIARSQADAYTVRYDANGNNRWYQPLGGTGVVTATALALDAFGNVYTAGNYSGRALLRKRVGPTGADLWSDETTGGQANYFYTLVVDNGGNVYACGGNISTSGAVTGLVAKFTQPFLSTPQTYNADAAFKTTNQSMWNSGTGGFSYHWNFFNQPWNINQSIGDSYTVPVFGTFGGSASFSTSGNVGMGFRVFANSGSVNADYPITLKLVFPSKEEIVAGSTFNLGVTWAIDPAARFTTETANAGAGLTSTFVANANARLTATAFSENVLDWTPINVGVNWSGDIIDTDTILGALLERDFNYGYVNGHVSYPKLVTSGAPIANGSVSTAAEKTFLSIRCDVTNFLTQNVFGFPTSIHQSYGPASLNAGVLQLYGQANLKLRQEFQYNPTAQLVLKFSDGRPDQTVNLNGPGQTTSIPVQMAASGNMTVTPTIKLPGNLTNTTKLVIDPIIGFQALFASLGFSVGEWDIFSGGVDIGHYTYQPTTLTGNLYQATFPVTGMAPVKGASFNIVSTGSNVPQIIGVSQPAITTYIYDQVGLDQDLFDFLVHGTTTMLVYGANFQVGCVGSFTHKGRTINLATTRIDSRTVSVDIPNVMRLIPGNARIAVSNGSNQGNSFDVQIQFPVPHIATIGPSLWAGDPRLLYVPLAIDDGKTPSGNDSFIARLDYYDRLQDLWNTSNLGLGTIASYFPDFDFTQVPMLPTVYFDGTPLPFYPQPVYNGKLYALLPPQMYATPHVASAYMISPGPGGGTSETLNPMIAAPTPVITSLNASEIKPGTSSFRLVVTGPANVFYWFGFEGEKNSNFNAASVVRVNGSNRTTTFISSSELQCDLTTADLATTRRLQITVYTPPNGTYYYEPYQHQNVTSGGSSAPVLLTVKDPTPRLTSLSPDAAETASEAFNTARAYNMTLNGSGFTASSIVLVNGNKYLPTFVDDTILQIRLTPKDVMFAGSLPVTVFNLNGGGVSNVLRFTLTNAAPTVTILTPSTAPATPTGVTTIAIEGTGFCGNTKVYWDGSERPIVFTDAMHISFATRPGDLATAGQKTITVTNPAPGGGSATATFTVQ